MTAVSRQHGTYARAETDGMDLEILPIPPHTLNLLRTRDDAGHRPARLTEHDDPGRPLRCCLRRSRPGEQLMLMSYAPLRRWASARGTAPGPYDELGPVFVHAGSCAGPETAEWPEQLRGTRRVLRTYSWQGRILGGSLLDTPARTRLAERTAGDLLLDPEVAFVHVRAVEFGCFLFEVRRA